MLIPCIYYTDRKRLKIRERCEQLGLTMKYVAIYTGLTITTMSHYHTGKSRPRMEDFKKISDLLGCKMDDLWHDPK